MDLEPEPTLKGLYSWAALVYFGLLARMYLRQGSPVDHRSLVWSHMQPKLDAIARERYRAFVVEKYGKEALRAGTISVKLSRVLGFRSIVLLEYFAT